MISKWKMENGEEDLADMKKKLLKRVNKHGRVRIALQKLLFGLNGLRKNESKHDLTLLCVEHPLCQLLTSRNSHSQS